MCANLYGCAMGKILNKRQSMTSIVVWNLAYCTTTKELERVFDKFGDVGDVYIPVDKRTRESRGFAFVRYFYERDAAEAMKEMHGCKLNGRELRISMAHKWHLPRETPVAAPGKDKSSHRSRRRGRSRTRSRSGSKPRSRSWSRKRSKRVRFSPLRRSSSTSTNSTSSREPSSSSQHQPAAGAATAGSCAPEHVNNVCPIVIS